MRRWPGALVLISIAVAAAGCQRAGPSRSQEPLATAFRPPGTSAIEEQGRRLFLERCATCHGESGHGDGQNAFNLDPPPPDFGESLKTRPSTVRRLIIEQGSAAAGRSALCPPRARTLRPEEIDALIAHLRILERQGLPGRTRRGAGSR
jgi:mono/diheme cytochrome c family protein